MKSFTQRRNKFPDPIKGSSMNDTVALGRKEVNDFVTIVLMI